MRTSLSIRNLIIGILFCLGTNPAQAEKIIAALSNTRVEISSEYTGSSITVFGTIERDAQTVPRVGPYNLVVTVRGPRQTMTVRERQRLGFIWLNRDQQKFQLMPAFLSVLSSHPLEEITSDALRLKFRIGMDAIATAQDINQFQNPNQENLFRTALLRLKKQENLYHQSTQGVTFLSPSLFSAPVILPATAPTGIYDVEVALFVDNTLLDRHYSNFELIKTGFQQEVGDMSKDYPLYYGLATALAALFFGWLANILFRRD
ncbi:TIGR02186 family protein [Microvirga sp. W0021]|uniref:TIGR02186 family protein n=1 Tax=Hohaiivirga grylli TaxID=3133970 RepID=A0ABV0BGP5_9HYPH